MRFARIVFAVITSLSMSQVVPGFEGPSESTWVRSYATGLKEAQQAGKPVLLDFTATWCPPCREMEKNVWPDPFVKEAMAKFVCVSVDVDKDPGTAMKYGANSIPLIVLTDPWGNPISKHTGYLRAPELVDWIDAFPDDFSEVLEQIGVADADPNAVDAMTQVAEFYTRAGALEMSRKYYDRALKAAPVKTDVRKREDVLIALGLSNLKLGDYGASRRTFERCLKECAGGSKRDVALLGLTTSQLRQGKMKEAEQTLAILQSEFPSSAATVQARKNVEAIRSAP